MKTFLTAFLGLFLTVFSFSASAGTPAYTVQSVKIAVTNANTHKPANLHLHLTQMKIEAGILEKLAVTNELKGTCTLSTSVDVGFAEVGISVTAATCAEAAQMLKAAASQIAEVIFRG